MSASPQSLRQSIDDLKSWLDSNNENFLGSDNCAVDSVQLRQLALKYKDFLLQLKDRHHILNSLKSTFKMIKPGSINPASPTSISHSESIQMLQDIDALQTKWSSTCLKAKKEYMKLSAAFRSVSTRDNSPLSVSSSNGSDSRHTTPEKVDDINGSTVVSLDSLLESLRLEAELHVESLNTELDAMSDVHEIHRPPPLPKPSVLSNSHGPKNGQTQHALCIPDKTKAYKRHSSGIMNSNTSVVQPTHPPPKPERKKPPLKVNNSCPSFSPADLSPTKKSHSVIIQIRPQLETDQNVPCRLSKKINDAAGLLKTVGSIIIPTHPCELQPSSVEGRLSAVKGVLTLLVPTIDELSTLIKEYQTLLPSSPAHTKSLSVPNNTTYTILEYACCADTLQKVYSAALDVNTLANEEISQIELIQKVVQEFQSFSVACREILYEYEKVVTELRNGMLVGKMADQPWTSVRQSLDVNQCCQEKLTSLEQLANQLLSLEPQFNGHPVKDQVQSHKDSYQALQVDASVVIQSAISHRLKFAKESCEIFDDWLKRVDAQLLAVSQGLLKGLAPHVKQHLCQQSTENIQTLLSTTDQLQHILNLATDTRAGILNKEQIVVVQSELANRKKKLEAANSSIKELNTCDTPAVVAKHTRTEKRQVMNNGSTSTKKKSNVYYTEIEAKEGMPSIRMIPPPMPPVYTEIIVPPKTMMDDIDYHLDDRMTPEGHCSSKDSTPIPRSLSPSVSPTRTILHSSSPERNKMFSTESPSPPPYPRQLYIENNRSTPTNHSEPMESNESSLKTNEYDIPRPHSFHITLLQYIDKEYVTLADIAQIDHGFHTPDLKETICLLSDYQGRSECQEFMGKLEKLKELLLSVKSDLTVIKTPREPLMTLINEEIQKCNVLRELLVSANALLSQYNYESSTIHASLSKSPINSAPYAVVDSTLINSVIIQLESELFDVSCLYHNCYSQLGDKRQALSEAERSVADLYSDLEQLTMCLEDAKNLLSHKDNMVDVTLYLKDCKEMHIKLAGLSDKRKNSAAKIRDLILHSTQPSHDNQPTDLSNTQPPPSTFKLLEQLKSIETQWVNVAHSLMNMHQLEPILLKNMITNIAKEVKGLQHVYPAVECDCLKLDELKKRFNLCENKLNRIKHMQPPLQLAKLRIEQLHHQEEKQTIYDHPRPIANQLLPDQFINDSNNSNQPKSASLDRTMIQSTKNSFLSASSSDDESSFLPLKRRSMGVFQCESSFDYILLTKSVLTLSGLLERAVSELEGKYMSLSQRILILEKFWNDSKSMSVWIRDTIHSLQENNGITYEPQVLLEEATAKKANLSEFQDIAKQILGLPSTPMERNAVKITAEKIVRGWQGMYKLLPLHMQVTIQPSLDSLTHLKPPDMFEDISQMIEWLILMESKLQPNPLDVGNTTQVKNILDEVEAMRKELQLKTSECHRFIKQTHHSDQNDSDSSNSSGSTTGSISSKNVKFHDENTLERFHRKKQIKQDIIMDTILSEDELDSEEDDSYISNNKSSHHSASLSSPPSLLSPPSTDEATQQLSVLWNGVWSSLSQRKQALESVLDIWSGYESKKVSLESFITQCENKSDKLLKGLENPTSTVAINRELLKLKTSSEEMALYQQRIGTLNDLTSDLIQRHKQTDNVNELQENMSRLNQRWRKIHDSYMKIIPSLDTVLSIWNVFYEHYQPFQDFLHDCDKIMTNINPNVTDILKLQCALEDTKSVHSALVSKSGQIGMIKQLNIKLQEATEWKKTNFSVINNELTKLEKKWEMISKLIDERRTSLDQVLAERKDILSILSRCETWCRHARDHINKQKPLTADVSILNAKIDVNKEFERELKEKQAQLSLSMARAKHITADFNNPNSLMYGMSSQEARSAFVTVQTHLQEILAEAYEYKKAMEAVFVVMNEFQILSTKFLKMLNDISACLPEAFQPQTTLPGLKQQLEKWIMIETSNSSLSKGLEAMVSSQKKLLEMGVQASPDAVQLVKKYHKQWNVLKHSINSNIDSIKKSIWKLDPNNLEMTLPRGWTKAKTVQGTPYYIDSLSGNHTQWQHPELSELHRSFSMRFKYNCFPSPAYPISLHLRSLQKCIHIEHVPTHVVMETFDMYKLNHSSSSKLTTAEMTEIVLSLYQRVITLQQTMPEDGSDYNSIMLGAAAINVNRAVELTVSWIEDVYDLTHNGAISVLAFETAIISLSTAKMEDKHKALFHVASNGNTTMTTDRMSGFLEVLLQIPQNMSDTQYCSLQTLEKSVQNCFSKFATGNQLHSVGYLAWAQDEPVPIAWLPILHRMTAAETMEHSVKCAVCRDPTIMGFRYKCLQCQNFNMCQECYWSGKTAKEHDRSTHFMEEYCISSDNKGMYFSTLGNRGRNKTRRNTPPSDSGRGPLSPNHISSQYDNTGRMHQLKQQLSNPVRKSSTPGYNSLSLRRKESSGSASSLLHSSKSALSSNKRNSNSYSNLTDEHLSLSKIAVEYPTSPKLSYNDAQLQSHPVRTQLPFSRSFDSELFLESSNNTPPPIPSKSSADFKMRNNDRDRSLSNGNSSMLQRMSPSRTNNGILYGTKN